METHTHRRQRIPNAARLIIVTVVAVLALGIGAGFAQ